MLRVERTSEINILNQILCRYYRKRSKPVEIELPFEEFLFIIFVEAEVERTFE